MPTEIRFKPWRGPNYGTRKSIFARRTFVLGGSSYSERPPLAKARETWASELIQDYRDEAGGHWRGTYTRFINAVYGTDSDWGMREAYFDSILFNNYLQDIAGRRPTDARKSDYDAEHHFAAFLETVRQHRPEVIICWGNLVWKAIREDWGEGPGSYGAPLKIRGTRFETYMRFNFEGSEILLVGVRHPSSAFSRDLYHQVFRRLGILA